MTEAMYAVTRATATLIGVGVAGFLLWLATQVGASSTGGYWARYGIVAGAGLVLALSQLLGGWTKWGMPRLARPVFLFSFVPSLIVVGWILLFHQPNGNWFGDHVANWSGDLGIGGFVDDLGVMLPALALGLGLVFGISFDTAGPRRGEVPVETIDHHAADEPLSAERALEEEPAAMSYSGAPEQEPESPPRNEPPA
jgi:hypothetical protein